MDKKRSIRRTASATVLLLSAAAMQILMFLPMVTVELPLSKTYSVSWCGTYNMANNIRSLIGGVDAIEHGAFWATVATCALEACVVMMAVSGVKSLFCDRRPTWSVGVFGGMVAAVISVIAAYIVFDTVYPYGMINGTVGLNATVWLMPCAALSAGVAAVVGRKGSKPE